jgi:uncharacterized protein involved in exopolysaccharide biosynthesis
MNQNLPVKRPDSSASSTPADKLFSIGEMGLRDRLSTIFKHKLMILVSFVLITGLTGASAVFYLKFIQKPVYEAKSLVLVRFGWENQNIDLSLDRRQPGYNAQEALATEFGILQSRDLKEKIINTLKPEVIFPDLKRNILLGLPITERALYRFERSFSLKSNAGNIIEVSFRGSDPATTATVVNELVDSYINKRADYY